MSLKHFTAVCELPLAVLSYAGVSTAIDNADKGKPRNDVLGSCEGFIPTVTG